MTVYKIDHIPKLIDLNGECINFDIKFQLSCDDSNINYSMCVVEQSKLDSGKELTYKTIKGDIEGTVKNTNNRFTNYFLVIKSDSECNIMVDINKRELPQTHNKVIENYNKVGNGNILPRKSIKPVDKKPKRSIGVFFMIVFLIVVVGWFVYKYIRRRSYLRNDDISSSIHVDYKVDMKPINRNTENDMSHIKSISSMYV